MDPSDYQAIFLVAGAIHIIVIITWFVLTTNVGKITRMAGAKNIDQFYKEYEKYKAFGEKEKAALALKEAAWLKMQAIKYSYATNIARHADYEKLKEQFNQRFIELEATFPEYPND